GAVYVFGRTDSQGIPAWSQQNYLKAANVDANDLFGLRVAIDVDTIIVGAPWEDSASAGVNGDDADNSALDAGAAYVFADVVPPLRIYLPLLVR
ncbi:MAG: FG-GAP repeat protein, partial [Herpetosiphonaceae bacterium]|nr:FG-GAP repeat protein [Herpetosiphonaceae bacterium]